MQNTLSGNKEIIAMDVLKYKKIGSEIGKLEFHLGMAAKSFNLIKDTCNKIEKETNVKINFLVD